MKFDYERKRHKVTRFIDVEYLGVPAVVEDNTINALGYLPPKKSIAGNRYKKKVVQVVPGLNLEK